MSSLNSAEDHMSHPYTGNCKSVPFAGDRRLSTWVLAFPDALQGSGRTKTAQQIPWPLLLRCCLLAYVCPSLFALPELEPRCCPLSSVLVPLLLSSLNHPRCPYNKMEHLDEELCLG